MGHTDKCPGKTSDPKKILTTTPYRPIICNIICPTVTRQRAYRKLLPIRKLSQLHVLGRCQKNVAQCQEKISQKFMYVFGPIKLNGYTC